MRRTASHDEGYDLPLRQARTAAALVLVGAGLWVLVLLSRPFNWWKTILVGAMGAAVAGILALAPLRHFYALRFPTTEVLVDSALVLGAALVALELGWRGSAGHTA